MSNRWQTLALLFGVRMTMAFQFQAVAALSPFMMNEFGFDIADIGLLIGLYFAPGVVLAYPGGELGKRFGEKHVVLWGLLMMIAGGLFMAAAAFLASISHFGVVIEVFVAGFLGAYLLRIISATTVGEDAPPDWPSAESLWSCITLPLPGGSDVRSGRGGRMKLA